MSGVPKEIPGFGDAALRIRLNPEFDALAASGLTTESYYVLSRIDGSASLHDIILMSGLGVAKAVGILGDLRGRGALLMPNETPESVRGKLNAEPEPPARPGGRNRAPTAELVLDDDALTDSERAALEEDVDLSVSERRRVLAMRQRIQGADYFAVLGVERDVDKRTLKRVYFKLSKDFHPDRYYGKRTGAFGSWLAEVFETCSRAYDTLSDSAARARYEAALRGTPAAAGNQKTGQSKAEHAASLFAEACNQEVSGSLEQALRLFAASIRVDPQPRYLRRAARCALAAENLAVAEEYAKKAVQLASGDPSVARILADVLRAGDRLDEAELIIVAALEMKNENDVLSAELQEDLAAIRKLRETRR